MSETQTYKGKFACTDLTVEEFVEENSKYLPDYCPDVDIMEKFYEITWEMCDSKDAKHEGFFEHKGLVYEVTELKDLQYSSFVEIDKVAGTFVTSFYDGGTCLSEMLIKGMEEDKDA